ncbi:MAG: hypothetical protein AAB400_00795 [Patescibacteria group bacterium]
MVSIRADLLIGNIAYSVTREAFLQYKELKNADRKKPIRDTLLLDKIGHILEGTRLDHSRSPEGYMIDGVVYPLFYRVSKQNAYRLAIVKAGYHIVVGIEPCVPTDDAKSVVVHEIDFHGEILGITDHALERFLERWIQYEKDAPLDTLKTLQKIVNKAEPDELSPALRVLRLINNGCVRTQYLRFGPWRLIIVDEEMGSATKVLVTFERRTRT